MENEFIRKLQEMYDESSNIVFFGGAGVSTESGIPDFRSRDGLYNQKWKYPPEQIISRTFFENNPKEFFRFYREKLIIDDAKPNAAHIALAKMESAGKLKAVITQNIDGLHQAAGSNNVFELHGSVLRNYCMNCGKFYDAAFIAKSAQNPDSLPHCEECGALVKPDVVLYEEALTSSDMINIGGTSLTVYPAVGLIDYFSGKYLVLINKSETSSDIRADLVIREKIGEVLGGIRI